MKPAVLFDLGNTLAAYYRAGDFRPILEESIRSVLAEIESREIAAVPLESALESAIAENRESPDFRVTPLGQRLERVFGLSFAEDTALEAALHARFLEPIFRTARVYDDTLSVLETLRRRGYPTGIVSNTPWGSPPASWRQEIARLGLAARVDAAVFCGDVGWRKPARCIFERAAAAVGREPEQCLFVGDDVDWDVAGSRSAGMRALLIDRDRQHPDFAGDRIETLDGLLGLLAAGDARSSSSGLVIRRAVPADAARLADIYNEAIETTTATFDIAPKTVDERDAWLRNRGDRFPVLVGEAGGTVMGYASLTPWSERAAYVDTAETGLYVHSSARGRGVGRRLYAAIIEEARQRGFHTLIARVTAESAASIRLHETEGFAVVGTMKETGRKFGRWLDVLIMQKMLD